MSNPLMEAIEGIGKSFEEMKKVNDQMLAEERAGNAARAKELKETLDKVSEELGQHSKNKEILEKRLQQQTDRLEILEALNDRPGKSVQDKIRDEHKDLAIQWIRSGGQDQDAQKKIAELNQKAMQVKDVTVGSAAGGGVAVPEEISRQIDKFLLRTSAVAANVKNVMVGTPDYKELISRNATTYAWSSETGSRTAKATPELVEIAPPHGELFSYLSASNWSLRDIFFNVENWLVDNVGEGFDVGLSAAIFNGDGSSKPKGMTHSAPTSADDYSSPYRASAVYQYVPVTPSSSPFTSAGVNADSVINLVYKLNPRYRAGAKFAASTITQGHLRKLKDTQGQYLWQPSLQAGQPDRLLGYEMFTWEDLGSPTGANALAVAFGDFNKAYTLTLITGMEVIRDQVTTPGYTKFYVARRFGGHPANVDALKFLKVAVS